jgi:hypothetical protein
MIKIANIISEDININPKNYKNKIEILILYNINKERIKKFCCSCFITIRIIIKFHSFFFSIFFLFFFLIIFSLLYLSIFYINYYLYSLLIKNKLIFSLIL